MVRSSRSFSKQSAARVAFLKQTLKHRKAARNVRFQPKPKVIIPRNPTYIVEITPKGKPNILQQIRPGTKLPKIRTWIERRPAGTYPSPYPKKMKMSSMKEPQPIRKVFTNKTIAKQARRKGEIVIYSKKMGGYIIRKRRI